VITEGGKDIVALQKENTDKANSAIDFLKAQGIEAKDIKTANYNVAPRYQYYDCKNPESSVSPCPPAEIAGYTITQTVSVKIRDFTKISGVISGVVNSGANSVSSISFAIDDQTALENQAKEQAITQAREKAELVAKAGGFSVGRLLSLEEGNIPYYAYGLGGGDMVKTASSNVEESAPTIEAGSQEIKVNVILRYEIE
jgi:hypothetical protein